MDKRFKRAFGILPRIENDPIKREEAIKKDIPVRFEIKQQKTKDVGFIDGLYNQDHLGKGAVKNYNDRILKYSQKHNLDPDMLRSVMFAENARGHKMGANYLMDILGKSDSIMPMNIQKNRWSSLVDKKPEDMYDLDVNIEAATVLLRRISDRVEKPKPEKIGSLWNGMSLTETNDFGNYIGKIYQEKPWKKLD